jgi:hypothetical protein
VLLFWPASARATQVQASDSLLPAAALHGFLEEFGRSDRSAQADIASRWLERTRRRGLSDDERLALAELHFVAFDPGAAGPGFRPFAGGTDTRARLATQRLLRMRMAAYDVYDGVEEAIREARGRLPAVATDPWPFHASVSTLARHYADRGDHEAVVRVVMEELSTIPVDGVFFSHTLPGEFISSFEQTGRRADAIAHMQRVRDALAHGERISREEAAVPLAPPHVDGVVHRLEEGLLRDLPATDVERRLRGRLYGMLSAYLARSR